MAKKTDYGTATLKGGTGKAMNAISGATKPAKTVPNANSALNVLRGLGGVINISDKPQETPQETPQEEQKKMDYLAMAAAYEAAARANFAQQQEAMARQLDASKQSTSSNYDSAAAGNYVNYMKQQNALGEQLAAQGIRGGASESALARIGNNYAQNQGNTTAQRYGALSQLQNSYDTNIANMRSAMEDNILANRLAMEQAQLQYEDTLAQREYEKQVRAEDIARAAKERKEDIAREEKWKKLEYKDSKTSAKTAQDAVGINQWSTKADIPAIKKYISKIKSKKGWEKNPVLYARVRAAQGRLGELKAL